MVIKKKAAVKKVVTKSSTGFTNVKLRGFVFPFSTFLTKKVRDSTVKTNSKKNPVYLWIFFVFLFQIDAAML